ncbi:MAG: hypothetical protein MUC43_02975 [Pirellula sp.]|jgi:hypothetical protein|nr:hypothetical protein [Pirellula sp.]
MNHSPDIVWPELPDCGVYLTWPQDGVEWIHPDDIQLAEQLIPSSRVFRRVAFDGTYYRLEYGSLMLRVKPTMWLKVHDEGFWIGDQVEIKGDFLTNEPSIAVITESRFEAATGMISYMLIQRDMVLDKHYHADELRCLTKRPEKLAARSDFIVLAPDRLPDDGLPKLKE